MNSNLPNKQGEGQRERREEGWQREGIEAGRLQPTSTASPGEGSREEVPVARQKPKLGSTDRSLLYKYITG